MAMDHPILSAIVRQPGQPIANRLEARFLFPRIWTPMQRDLQTQSAGRATQVGNQFLSGGLSEPHQGGQDNGNR